MGTISKDQKIAIIGAGISGLTAAHTLKKLDYNNITIFESHVEAGGKIHSLEKDGNIYELGAIFLPDGADTVESMAREYNFSLTNQAKKIFFYSKGKQVSHLKCLRNNIGITTFIKCMLYFFKFALKFKNYQASKTPGFTEAKPELYVNFKTFLEKNKIGEFDHVSEPLSYTYCYGYLNSTPTFYFLKLLDVGLAFMIKEMLNSSLGCKFRLLPIFDKGYQNLLKEIASNFDVRYNSKVTSIKRDKTGDSPKIHITVNGKAETFDRVIISSQPFHTMEFLDMNNDEKELFSKVKYYSYHEFLFYGAFDMRGAGLIFENTIHKKSSGFPAALSNFHPDNNLYQTYQMHDGSISEEELKNKLYEMADMLGGKINEIILSKNITYFPHYIEKDLAESRPFKRLEEAQGENGTYFIGSLFNMEGASWSADYADFLINKHF